MRILAVCPPAGSSIAFEQEFQSAYMDLVDALIPDGVDLRRYIADHVPDAADLRTVEELARARAPRSPGRF
jgi:hypothetical protein